MVVGQINPSLPGSEWAMLLWLELLKWILKNRFTNFQMFLAGEKRSRGRSCRCGRDTNLIPPRQDLDWPYSQLGRGSGALWHGQGGCLSCFSLPWWLRVILCNVTTVPTTCCSRFCLIPAREGGDGRQFYCFSHSRQRLTHG